MRSVEDQMKAILRRKEYYLAVRQVRRMTALEIGLGCLLIGALLAAPGIRGTVLQPKGSALGATILGAEAGGYVIVALLAFALGMATTLTIQRFRQAKRIRDGQDKNGGDAENHEGM